jgi:hypothetical protein
MIYINGNALNIQPTILLEELLQIQTDQVSINGSMTRNRIGMKKRSTMEFTIMSPSDYQTLIGYFSTGSGIYYSNDTSSYTGGVLSFSGLPNFEEGEYVPGSTLYRPLKVVIREI